ncbi:MAG: hypothetical protein KAH20_04900 [Methylococcales bacterium]|nr:hypothetical protein [Methylococcales bacterium]
MSKKNAIYKYNAMVKHRSWKEYAISFVPFVIFLIIFLIKPLTPVFFFGIVISIALGFALLNNHNHIAISPRFFIIGDRVILYRNVVSLFVKGSMGTALFIETRNGDKYSIEKNNFTSNARKSWKIEKHQKAKFIKVVTKILEKCTDLSTDVSIQVENFSELKSFKRN